MGIIAIFLSIVSITWLFHGTITWLPINLLSLIGQGFRLSIGIILLSFILWCFKE